MTNTPTPETTIIWLRSFAASLHAGSGSERLVLDAADTIERQSAEIARLREALGVYENALSEAEAIFGGEYADQYGPMFELALKARAALAGRPVTCKHEWIDARNSRVSEGELCLKCGAIRAGNQTEENTDAEV